MPELLIPNFVCAQPTCKFPVDGKCIEGLPPPETCPFRKSLEEASPTENSGNDIISKIEPIYIKTHKGEALNDEGCDSLMAGVKTKLVILAGLKDSGKTTLLGSLMQLFQDHSSFAGYGFAGSETLVGFEKICHDSRMNSGRAKAHTARTVKGFDGILHLKIKAIAKDSKKEDLLFTNLSGEDFDLLSKSSEFCKRFVMSKRANHFALFLDGDLLSSSETRQVIRTNSINVLMGLLDAGMIAPETKIDIIFSRWDLILDKDDIEKHTAFIDQVKVDLERRIRPYNLDLNFFEIASRPDKLDVLNFGHGLENLFKTLGQKQESLYSRS